MVRVAVAASLVAFWTALFAVPTLLAGAFDRKGRLAHGITRQWARLVLIGCGVDVSLSGLENLPAGPAVFAANHGSALDIPILFGYLPVGFRIIHKRSLYLLPIIGWYLWLAGHIGIDRGNPFKARKSLDAAAERMRGGTSFVVFPEGTRSRDGGVGLFKRGSFVLAIAAGVPVVPVSLAGVKQVVPHGLLTLTAGRVRVRLHPPLPTAGRTRDDAEALAEATRTAVVAALAEA